MHHQKSKVVFKSPKDIQDITIYFAKKYSLNPRFLAALVETESSGNKWSMRYEPGYIWLYSTRELADAVGCSKSTMESIQKTSWGLCQIMGAVIYEMGFRGWPGEAMEPEVNLKYGCEYLVKLIRNHDLSFAKPNDLYASYNAGSVRLTMEKTYVNQSAVTHFMRNYESLPSDYGLV